MLRLLRRVRRRADLARAWGGFALELLWDAMSAAFEDPYRDPRVDELNADAKLHDRERRTRGEI